MKRYSIFLAIPLLAACVSNDSSYCTPCDIDGDGDWRDEEDLAAFDAAFGSYREDADFNPRADFDGSGSITSVDFAALMKCQDKE